jgi:hypothetical protein
MTPGAGSREALAFVERHGVVLASAKGPVPRLTEFIVGAPIEGSWWGHPLGKQIYRVLGDVTESDDILVCRAVAGKVTLVHRRMWPALVSAAALFDADRLARVIQEHTAAGRHVNHEVPFPGWADAATLEASSQLSEHEAAVVLGPWVPR